MKKQKKLTEKQKQKAFKAFEASEVMQMPIEERQKGAIFQCHVTRIIENIHNDGNFEGGKKFVQQGMGIFAFTADQMRDFIQGIGDMKKGMETALDEYLAQHTAKAEEETKPIEG